MKRMILIILIAIWILFNSSGKKSEWYLIVYKDENVILKAPRDQYLEFYDLLYEKTPGKIDKYAQHVLLNESKMHTENEAGRNIEIERPDFKTLIEIYEKYVLKQRNQFLTRLKSYPELWN